MPGPRLRKASLAIARQFVFAYATATVVGFADTFTAVQPQSLEVHCLAITVAAWAAPAAVVGAAAVLLRGVLSPFPRARRALWPPPERVPAHLAAVTLAVAGACLIDVVLRFAVLGNEITQRIAIVIGVFCLILGAGLVYRPFVDLFDRVLSRFPSALRHPSLFAGFLVLLAIIGIVAGRAIEPDYFREVGWQTPTAVAAVFLMALAGASAPRWTAYFATVVAALGLGIMVWHATTTAPAAASRAVQQRGRVTPWLLEVVSRPVTRRASMGPTEIQACRPGETLTPVAQIGAAGENAPDIVLLTIDGWRWDHTSMARVPGRDVTPQLATHARRAAVFERAYPPATSTRQSFRSLFSGVINGRVGSPPTSGEPWGLSFVEGQPTLAAYLSSAGYETIALVMDHGAFPEEEHGLQGFVEIDDRYIDFRKTHGYAASYVMNSIMARLSRAPAPGEPPRFVWAHLLETHFPFSHGPELPRAGRLPYHERHLHSLRYVDQQIGRLLEFLAGRERKEHTWVFVTSDHGEQFDEHGGRRHGSEVYEEEARVPLLVWGPGVRPGRRTTAIELVDLMPTMLDAAGLEIPSGLCGESLLDPIREGREPPADPIYVAAVPDQTREWFKIAWIDGQDKLIVHGHTGQRELYDLEADPGEQNDLVAENPEVADRLTEALRAFYRDHGLDPRDYALDP